MTDEIQGLERWIKAGFHIAIFGGFGGTRWSCTISEPLFGSMSPQSWEDYRITGQADDFQLALQSALIQARAKWPGIRV